MQISRLATACTKIHQIPRHFWNQESVFLQTLHYSSVSWDITLCTFSSKYLCALDKRIQSKCKFSDFQLLAWKLIKFIMSFFNPQVSFRLNFATPFSVMTHNSSESFYMLWTKRAYQCTIFRLLGALMMKVHPIPHAIFETTRSGFFKFCNTVQCHER